MTAPTSGADSHDLSKPSIDPASTVGGQAVLEGVMMRAPTAWAVAVRRPDSSIEAERHELPRLSTRSTAARIPFVRGVMVLGESLVLGFRALSWSAQKAVDEEEEEPLTKRDIALSMTVAMVFFVGVFMLLPVLIAGYAAPNSTVWFNVVEALVRLGLFVGYIWAIGRSKEIARVFEFHGAEHMTIHAYEAGDPLTIESIEKYPPEHPRCGTSFLMIVILASIVLFTLLGRPSLIPLIASRVIGIPIIAGISYELIRFTGLGRETLLARIVSAPGLWLQKLTTGRPAADQIEVAIASMLTALDDEQVEDVRRRGDVPDAAIQARIGALTPPEL